MLFLGYFYDLAVLVEKKRAERASSAFSSLGRALWVQNQVRQVGSQMNQNSGLALMFI